MWRFLINLETAKTLSRLHLSSKSLPGVLENVEVPEKLENSRNLRRLHLSSNSLPGVLEDIKVPDDPGDGVICQDSTGPSSLLLES